ncbi:MAG: FAD binding domain-containing protein [Planctomycetes bacterium]|nr:FAD binding domain-containing protein [Planctomycetota bacterium]
MNPFELRNPDSVAAASGAAGPARVFKAAGIDLLDRLKERIDDPDALVNLLPLGAELGGIGRSDDGTIRLGALVTLQQIADSDALAAPGLRALREACGEAATPQVRSRATLGGNLLQRNRCWYFRSAAFQCAHDGKGDRCLAWHGENRYHAIFGVVDCLRVHPSNAAPPLMVLGAEVEVQRGEARRRQPIAALFPDSPAAATAEHTLGADDVLIAVHLPAAAARGGSAYRESREKQSFDWATTAAAVHLGVEGGRITSASICLGAVAPNPWPVDDAQSLVGEAPSRELFEQLARRVFRRATPTEQNRYKVEVGQAILVDALLAAAGL